MMLKNLQKSKKYDLINFSDWVANTYLSVTNQTKQTKKPKE